tara:strand:- start:755 stop:1327 length:573 start_codon:yes stop_codon:yes gene_type:complete
MKKKLSKLFGNDVLEIIPKKFQDERGYFQELFNSEKISQLIDKNFQIIQENHSMSSKGVLRGMHAQLDPYAQSKIVTVIAGEVIDVLVDIRLNSKTFGMYDKFRLSAENGHQLYVSKGFAHGFLVVSDFAEVIYKVDQIYSPNHEFTLNWDDPEVGINWENEILKVSDKDSNGLNLRQLKDYLEIGNNNI